MGRNKSVLQQANSNRREAEGAKKQRPYFTKLAIEPEESTIENGVPYYDRSLNTHIKPFSTPKLSALPPHLPSLSPNVHNTPLQMRSRGQANSKISNYSN
jgi:hypothetical protein